MRLASVVEPSTWYLEEMRCQVCDAEDTRVVDSRPADDGSAIRRRRHCTSCGQRFTTFERVESAPAVVLKRSGNREPFVREKVVAGVTLATKGRPVTEEQLRSLTKRVEDRVKASGQPMPTEEVGNLVLAELKELDSVAALRFASVYKHFEDLADFEREASLLLDP